MAPDQNLNQSSSTAKQSIPGNASLLIGIGLLVYLVYNYSARHVLGLEMAPFILSIIGFVLGIVGLLQKGVNKKFAIAGVVINLGINIVPLMIILSWR